MSALLDGGHPLTLCGAVSRSRTHLASQQRRVASYLYGLLQRALATLAPRLHPAIRRRYAAARLLAPITFVAIISPIGMAAVAAGEGALQTCSMRLVSSNRKSWTSVPSLLTACARIPAS